MASDPVQVKHEKFFKDAFRADNLLTAFFLLLGACAFIARIDWLSKRRYPLDYDGFYYLQELASRQLDGKGYYHQGFHPFFSTVSSIGSLFRLEPLQTLHLSILVSLLLFAVALALLAWNTNRRFPAAALFALALQSEPLFYLHYGYTKQGLGTALAACGFALLLFHDFRASRPDRLSFAGLICICLGAVTHLFAGVLAAVLLYLKLWEREGSRRPVAASAGLLLSGVIALALYSRGVFSGLRLESQLAWEWAYSKGWLSSLEVNQYRYYALLGCSVILAAAVSALRSRMFWGLALLWLFLTAPIWRTLGGVCQRWLISGVPVLLLMASAAFAGLRRRPPFETPSCRIVFSGILLIGALMPSMLSSSARPVGPGIPAALFEKNAAILKRWIPESAAVVAPHGIQFQVSYFLKRTAARTAPLHLGPLQLFEIRRRTAGDCCASLDGATEIPLDAGCAALDRFWVITRRR